MSQERTTELQMEPLQEQAQEKQETEEKDPENTEEHVLSEEMEESQVAGEPGEQSPEEAEAEEQGAVLEVPECLRPEVEIPVEEDLVPEDGYEEEVMPEDEEIPEDEGMPEEGVLEEVPEEEPAAEEIRFHDIPRVRKKRKQKHYLLRAFTVIGVLVIIGLILMSPLFDIQKIEVEGNDYYTDKQIINMSGAQKGQNIFLHAGAGGIKEKLSTNPYFADVSVRRHLPSTLVIKVDERPQVAALKFGENYVIIDQKGRVLRIGEYMPKLTLLTGLTLSKIEVGEKIEAEEKENLAITLDMLHTMDKGDLYFKEIQIEDLNIKAYIYDLLMVNGRPANVKKAIENGDLQKVVNKLYKSKTRRGIITVGDDDYLSFSPAI